MKNLILLFTTICFANIAYSQVPVTLTYDATTALNTATMIENTAETVNKMDDLNKSYKETTEMLSKVSSAISSGIEIKNIMQSQVNIINTLGSINQKINKIQNVQERKNYEEILDIVKEKTNDLIKKVNSILQQGTFKMTDFERLSFLSDIEKEIQGVERSLKRMEKNIK